MANWRKKFIGRQRNILPHETIPNSAYFDGTLFLGNRRLGTLQRIGAAVYGLCILSMGSVGIAAALASFRKPHTLDRWMEGHLADAILEISSLLVGALFFFWGFRVTLNALVGGRQPSTHENDSV